MKRNNAVKKRLLNWLDATFGSFPEWGDLPHLNQVIGFKTRYGYVSTPSIGEIQFDPVGCTLFVNVSSDPYNPMWKKI